MGGRNSPGRPVVDVMADSPFVIFFCTWVCDRTPMLSRTCGTPTGGGAHVEEVPCAPSSGGRSSRARGLSPRLSGHHGACSQMRRPTGIWTQEEAPLQQKLPGMDFGATLRGLTDTQLAGHRKNALT